MYINSTMAPRGGHVPFQVMGMSDTDSGDDDNFMDDFDDYENDVDDDFEEYDEDDVEEDIDDDFEEGEEDDEEDDFDYDDGLDYDDFDD